MLQIETINEEMSKRPRVAEAYRQGVRGVPGIRCLEDQAGIRHNYGYFPILVDEASYGMSRDDLYSCLREYNILTRNYFHPLVSNAPC